MKTNKNISFINEHGKKDTLRTGALIVAYTNRVEDAYKSTDPQVISGLRKEGERKKRKGRILLIQNATSIIVQFVSSKDKLGTNWDVPLSDGSTFSSRDFYLQIIQSTDVINQKGAARDFSEENLVKIVNKIISNNRGKPKIINKLKNAYN